jgi:hypothetical protein
VFSNTDRLLAEINGNLTKYGMTFKYATVEEYFSAIHATGTQWPVRGHKDFFPLAYNTGKDLTVWSGFYASRPLLMQESRRITAQLTAVEGLVVRGTSPRLLPPELCVVG